MKQIPKIEDIKSIYERFRNFTLTSKDKVKEAIWKFNYFYALGVYSTDDNFPSFNEIPETVEMKASFDSIDAFNSYATLEIRWEEPKHYFHNHFYRLSMER